MVEGGGLQHHVRERHTLVNFLCQARENVEIYWKCVSVLVKEYALDVTPISLSAYSLPVPCPGGSLAQGDKTGSS